MTTDVDPITLGVVWGALQSIAVEIGTTIHRTAYSEQAREGQDFSVALFDKQGRLLVQGPYSPGHLGAMNFAILNAMSAYPPETLHPGDVILLNDPALGSGHFPDFFVSQPAFHGDHLVGFSTNIVHHTDVGGARPGSQAVEGIFDYHQEGIFIPPIKIVEEGREVEQVIRLIAANSRTPENLRGDLRAQRNSMRVGERRMAELVEQHGLETYEACVEIILDQSEARVRRRIAEIPDGAYRFEDYMDDCGPGTDPIKVAVTVTVDGDNLLIDFEGTDPQTESGLNSYFNYTRSYTYMAVKCLTDPSGPMNAGALRPVTISAPEGSFVNPRRPAGGGPRAIVCHRVFEVVIGALAQAVPEDVVAACSHFANPTWGGIDPARGRRFVTYELVFGGTGARARKDGVEAMSSPFNASNIPAEALELTQPAVVERFEIVPDTGGAGEFRGGCAVRRDVRILGDKVKFNNLSERQRFQPYGLGGAEPGALGRTVVNPGRGTERVIPGKASVDLGYGDVVSFQLSGAGGYGDPMSRDPERVARDVRLGYVSVGSAAERYGVVIADDGSVDRDATAARRAGAPNTS
ncbi:MAG TPA: hydantoinase B/oxoprolinase family protein [Actinomycetota bacterium]|jgi:N-methylhydantoinase B